MQDRFKRSCHFSCYNHLYRIIQLFNQYIKSKGAQELKIKITSDKNHLDGKRAASSSASIVAPTLWPGNKPKPQKALATELVTEDPESIMKDIKFANISGASSFLNLLTATWEIFNGNKEYTDRSHPLSDLFVKIRQLAQYSIHAKPSSETIIADDIRGDSSHNLAAVGLGITSYWYSAFVGPWMYLLKNLVGADKDSGNLASALNRVVSSVDEIIIPKIINIYWNIRRVSKALIPYSEQRLTSKNLEDAHTKIKNTVSKFVYWAALKLPNWLFAPIKLLGWNREKIEAAANRIDGGFWELASKAGENYLSNIAALRHGKYKVKNSNKVLQVGEQNPDNHPIYAWSRLLSQVLGFPVGISSAACNIASMGIATAGRLLKSSDLENTGIKLGYLGVALQTLLYASNEIPAHLHVFLKDFNSGKLNRGSLQSLGIFSSGALAAILVWMRPFTDSIIVKKLASPFFRLFFSTNRIKLHRNEYNHAARTSLRSEVASAEKIRSMNPLSIIFKVLFRDENFTYPLTLEDAANYSQKHKLK